MKNQALFSSKDKSKKLKCRMLQFLFVALRVNCAIYSSLTIAGKSMGTKYWLTNFDGQAYPGIM